MQKTLFGDVTKVENFNKNQPVSSQAEPSRFLSQIHEKQVYNYFWKPNSPIQKKVVALIFNIESRKERIVKTKESIKRETFLPRSTKILFEEIDLKS
jgi:hypothetical protein